MRQIQTPCPPRYIWERLEWPAFRWNAEAVLPSLGQARRRQGILDGALREAGFNERQVAFARAVTEEALETSEIEGEKLDPDAVRSSVARRLGLPEGGLGPEDARADGVVAITLDATQQFGEPLTVDRLHRWHAELFPLERGENARIPIARWRDDSNGPMQVVSGPVHRRRVHFEAPPAQRVPDEVDHLLSWFNAKNGLDGLIRTAYAHLWFVTIHPYADGNGRIGRAIADMALAQDEVASARFISMSRQIRRDTARYYDMLEQTQLGDLDITLWLQWFLACYVRAAEHALVILGEVLRAARFWRQHQDVAFNARQKKVLARFLHEFEGKLTAKKWATIAKTSLDTAQRDIAELLARDVLLKNPGGSKNTSYSIREGNESGSGSVPSD